MKRGLGFWVWVSFFGLGFDFCCWASGLGCKGGLYKANKTRVLSITRIVLFIRFYKGVIGCNIEALIVRKMVK